jgi:peptidoglycan LD-endopeptidase LytH
LPTGLRIALIVPLFSFKLLFWQLQSEPPDERRIAETAAFSSSGAAATVAAGEIPAVAELTARGLAVPVAGVRPSDLRDTFAERRSGNRVHGALDIMAPRGTPVVAVEAGTVARKFQSSLGGISLYEFDPSGSYCYYYAHLDRYAAGLVPGAAVERGQVLGYVGSTGNARRDAPHLHFAIYRREPAGFRCQGPPVNPYPVFRRR